MFNKPMQQQPHLLKRCLLGDVASFTICDVLWCQILFLEKRLCIWFIHTTSKHPFQRGCSMQRRNKVFCLYHHGLFLGKKGVGRKPNSFYNIFTDGLWYTLTLGSINGFKRATCLCLSQAWTLISIGICHDLFFMFHDLSWDIVVHFIVLSGIVDHW